MLSLPLLAACHPSEDTSNSPSQRSEIIVHRGYLEDGAPENSLEALLAAQQRDWLYGIEIDVWLTADDIPALCHERDFQGKTIEHSTYSEMESLKLPNGESLPQLENFLAQAAKTPWLKIILDIKNHERSRGERAIDRITELVEQAGMLPQVEYQSIDIDLCRRMLRNAPRAMVGYAGGGDPSILHNQGIRILDYNYVELLSNPSWIKDAKSEGIRTNAWTINSYIDMLHAANSGIIGITTDLPEKLHKVLTWREQSCLSPLLKNVILSGIAWKLQRLRIDVTQNIR